MIFLIRVLSRVFAAEFFDFAFLAPFAVNSPGGSIKTLDLKHYAQEIQRNARAGARPAHLREAGTRRERRICLCARGTRRRRAHAEPVCRFGSVVSCGAAVPGRSGA